LLEGWKGAVEMVLLDAHRSRIACATSTSESDVSTVSGPWPWSLLGPLDVGCRRRTWAARTLAAVDVGGDDALDDRTDQP
jgi:hypothetical protein